MKKSIFILAIIIILILIIYFLGLGPIHKETISFSLPQVDATEHRCLGIEHYSPADSSGSKEYTCYGIYY
jgi:hypothetical protein